MYLFDKGLDDHNRGFCTLEDGLSNQNLASKLGIAPADAMTFDAVVVDKAWRGKHLQRHFIDWTAGLAKENDAKHVLATVSSDNGASKHNFLAKGFQVATTKEMYNGVMRDIMCLDINET